MQKKTAALLLIASFLTLLLGISITKEWLITMNIPIGENCALSSSDNPAERKVCKNGTCILYSDWIEMSEEERNSIE